MSTMVLAGKQNSNRAFSVLKQTASLLSMRDRGAHSKPSAEEGAHQLASQIFYSLIHPAAASQGQADIEGLKVLVSSISEAKSKNILSDEEADAMLRYITSQYLDAQVNGLFKGFAPENPLNAFAFHSQSNRGLIYGK